MILRRRGRDGSGPRLTTRQAQLPTVNMLVRLTRPSAEGTRGADGEGLASRVEDVQPAGVGHAVRFLVAAPGYPGDLLDDPDDLDGADGADGAIGPVGPEHAGDPSDGHWRMSWVTDRARWELPVQRRRAVGVVPRSWWLTPSGPVLRRQRRRFYRAGTCVPVELDELADPYRTLSGRTLDISEGGLRCVVPLPDGDLPAGTRVLVRVALEGVDGVLAGVVLRSRRPAPPARIAGWHREVAIAFDDPERHGDALRKVVVRLQLRSRRLGPPGLR